MIDFLTLILSLTVTGTFLFGALRCLAKIGFSIQGIYLMERLVCWFYLLPALVIIYWLYLYFTKDITVLLNTEDFQYIRYNMYWELLLLKNDDILHTVNRLFFTIWSIGFIVFYIIDLIYSLFLLNRLLNQCLLVKEKLLCGIMDDTVKELNIKKNIKLYQSDKIDMPFTTGFFRMKVVLPKTDISKEEWKLLLRHELIHCKRNDVLMKLVVQFVQKIHWFNPAIFLFTRSFFEDSEYTCDMEVVKSFNSEQRIEYCRLVIKMAEERPMPKFTIGFSENNFKFVERRLQYIMKKKAPKTLVMTAIIMAFMAVCPVITYASASGVSQVERALINVYARGKETGVAQDIQESVSTKMDMNSKVYESEYLGRLDAKGTNNIDVTIKSSGMSTFSPVSLNSGSSIRISVASDNVDDSFRAGIIMPDGKKLYVASVDGMIGHTFNISSGGSYTVYLEGRNGSSDDIHITGTIYVNY